MVYNSARNMEYVLYSSWVYGILNAYSRKQRVVTKQIKEGDIPYLVDSAPEQYQRSKSGE